jgi:fructose 1,6-bisphosphate aldolase/phosphatase
MKITVSVIKADIGSIGGHIQPSALLVETVRKTVADKGKKFLIDSYVGYTGDDIAILMTHTGGVLNEEVHKLAWDTFLAGTAVAKEQGLYGAGQDLLKDSFSGNVTRPIPARTTSRATSPSRTPWSAPGSSFPPKWARGSPSASWTSSTPRGTG